MQNLYIIQSDKYYKIGIANDVKTRLAQLQTGNPTKLLLVSYWAFENAEVVEKALHQKFAGARVSGEWFAGFDGRTIEEVNNICKMLGGVCFDGVQDVTEDELDDEDDMYQASQSIEYCESIMKDPRYRIETRRNGAGDIRGFAWITRTSPRQCVLFVNQTNRLFEQIKNAQIGAGKLPV